MIQASSSKNRASYSGLSILSDDYSFPFALQYSVASTPSSGNVSTMVISSAIQHGYERTEFGSGLAGLRSGSTIKASQSSTGFLSYPSDGAPRTGNGTSSNSIEYSDVRAFRQSQTAERVRSSRLSRSLQTSLATYHRDVDSAGVNIVRDSQSGSLYVRLTRDSSSPLSRC